MPQMPKMTPAEARAAGFIVDSHCYPWVAYKGPRFAPTECFWCWTDDEAKLRAALQPFANAATSISPDAVDADALMGEAPLLTIGNVRAAAAALAS